MTRAVFGFGLLATLPFLTPARGGEIVFRGGPARVALLELYTSEGCSSCPPAEQWLGERRGDPGLWRDFVPVAFHVNYWDHLGWRDVLASPAFTERERAYAAAWHADSVYTPCFVRNGQEWRPRGDRVERERDAADAGTLSLGWQPTDDTCEIRFAGALPATATLDVSVALLGGGIVHAVGKGENSGRELRHEFVVLRLATTTLRRDATGVWSARVTLPPREDISAPRHALAGWVTRHGSHVPLQAAGGWLE